jgi:hypothetical protein
MQSILLIIIVITILVLFIFGLAIYGAFFYKASPSSEIYIDPTIGTEGKVCQREPVRCATLDDCKNACSDYDTVEMDCVKLGPRYTEAQKKVFGEGGKFCLPKLPEKPCDKSKGGINVWTGWAGIEQMEWDCLCTWPDYYDSDSGCTKRNSGICTPGTFNFDITKGKAPSADNCTCPNGYTKLIRGKDGSPICISSSIDPKFYGESYIKP